MYTGKCVSYIPSMPSCVHLQLYGFNCSTQTRILSPVARAKLNLGCMMQLAQSNFVATPRLCSKRAILLWSLFLMVPMHNQIPDTTRDSEVSALCNLGTVTGQNPHHHTDYTGTSSHIMGSCWIWKMRCTWRCVFSRCMVSNTQHA